MRICLKGKTVAQSEFELSHYSVTVQYVSYYTGGEVFSQLHDVIGLSGFHSQHTFLKYLTFWNNLYFVVISLPHETDVVCSLNNVSPFLLYRTCFYVALEPMIFQKKNLRSKNLYGSNILVIDGHLWIRQTFFYCILHPESMVQSGLFYCIPSFFVYIILRKKYLGCYKKLF